jgi:hypothetical protein
MAKTDLPRIAASQSFTEEEVLALDSLLSIVRRGGDARLIARSPAMRKVQQKAVAMADRCKEIRRIRDQPPPARVGTPVSGTEEIVAQPAPEEPHE